MDSDKELIAALVDWAGKSASEVARDAGLAVSTLTRPLNHPVKYRLSFSTLAKLRERYPSFPGFGSLPDLPPEDTARDYMQVEILPTFAGMGGGGNGDGDVVTALVPRYLIEDVFRGRPSDFRLVRTRGDSMEPDFRHDDEVLIDLRDKSPTQPGPFAVWDGDGHVLKNIERTNEGLRLFPSNREKYNEAVIHAERDDFYIMGRAIWFARRL
ncbi:MAG: LexA family transcriptional regulator [Burkholderiaceae bacterium]